jgi:hypothetical protein
MKKTELTAGDILDLLFCRDPDIRNAQDRHSLETPACLYLTRFSREAVEQWTEDEREHVRTCRTGYCQRMLALSWRGEHPPLAHLSQYARGEYPYPAAMEFHLERDHCWRCQIVVNLLKKLGSLAGAVAVGHHEGTLAPLEAAAFAEPRAPVYLRQTSEDGKLIVTVVETDPPEHELKVYVEAPGCGEAGGKVRVTLAGKDKPPGQELELELELEKTESGWRAQGSFGSFADAVAQLGQDWVVVAVLVESEG